jgi:hypothetical protein
VLLARWLPVRFEYRPNDLGIVSVATQQRYPIQQETFWLIFAVAGGTLLTWLLARAFASSVRTVRAVVVVEALGAAALLCVLWLPALAGAIGCAASALGAIWLAARGGGGAPLESAAPSAERRAPRRSALRTALWWIAVLSVVLVLLPDIWVNSWHALQQTPDDRLVYNRFEFQAEDGQHLAWANAILHGGFPGKDFFTLYGPLYDMGLVGVWKLVGRSITGWGLFYSSTRLAAWLAFMLLGRSLLGSRAWVLALPLLMTRFELRIGLPLFGISLLVLWLKRERWAWCAAVGVVSATSLLYSQEFGLALLLTAVLALALRRDARSALAFAGGLAALLLPVFAWFHANDALVPMLRDLVQYPSFMMAGYAKLPFPPIVSNLPLDLFALDSYESRELRYGYAVPAICVAAALLVLPVSALDPRHPIASLRRALDALARDPARLALLLTAVFGLIAFRSALGRSSLARTIAVAPPAAVLLAVAFERAVALWRRGGSARTLGRWRVLALTLFALISALPEKASPLSVAGRTVERLSILAGGEHMPVGRRRALRVVRWIQLNTEPGEPVLFLPNNAAFYYLTDRPNPTRFVLASQMVTDGHRREVLADLQSRPPRFIVWDRMMLRVDDLSDEEIFGPALLRWFEENYETETFLGTVEVLRRRKESPGEW